MKTIKKNVFLYALDSESKDFILHKSFNNSLDAAKLLGCSIRSIYNYLDKNK